LTLVKDAAVTEWFKNKKNVILWIIPSTNDGAWAFQNTIPINYG